MLESHCQLFPEGTSVFNFFYGTDSPVFLSDNGELLLIRSSQGSRQGCAAGMHGFALGLHPLLVKLQSMYPEFEMRALKDDIISLVPPLASNSFDDWQKTYLQYADFLNDLHSLSLSICGLTLNCEKAGLLLPPGAPQPTAFVRSKFPPSFDFQIRSFREPHWNRVLCQRVCR